MFDVYKSESKKEINHIPTKLSDLFNVGLYRSNGGLCGFNVAVQH